MSDWIDDFMTFSEGKPTPEIFRLWSGISCVAASLEHRVYTSVARSILYTNLYVLLVAPPAVGKTQAINMAYDLWMETKDLHIAPNNISKAALVDVLNAAGRVLIAPSEIYTTHPLTICCSELGVLLPAHDLEFLSVLNDIYDNPPMHREQKRTGNLKLQVDKPMLNILAGTQPAFMSSILPEEAWGMGTTARFIMVYSGTPIRVDIFDKLDPRKAMQDSLISRLKGHLSLFGAAHWEPDAIAEMRRWYMDGCQPTPEHSKLQHYLGRRWILTMKLAMVSAVSRTGTLLVTLADLTRARDWLLSAEMTMPDIFREMVLKSDDQIIHDLHFHLWRMFIKDKKPLHESRVWDFLKSKAPSEKIPRIIEAAQRSNVIMSNGNGMYSPRPRHEWGME